MPVITTDVLLKGIKRDEAFEWLSQPSNHGLILKGAFDEVSSKGGNEWEVVMNAPPRPRKMGYIFGKPDDSHSGRRVLCTTTGKRTKGKLHYSLRTMKPNTNTMLTIHMDYNPGGMLGSLVNSSLVQNRLETGLKRMAENARLAMSTQ